MSRLLNWFRRRPLESSLDRELQYHLDRRIADHLRSGLPEHEARRRATLEMGGIPQIREDVRDVWLTRWLRDFAYDLRFSARSFRRSPAFTATGVLSFALGIGTTTAIFSLVNQIVLHALPVHDPSRLVLLDWKGDQAATGFGTYNLMSYPLCRDLQGQTRFFDGVLCRALIPINLSTGREPKPAVAEIVSGSYFSVLGVRPALGRMLTEEDDRPPHENPVAVLSYSFWKSGLAGAPDVIGRQITIDQHPMTVVGVAAPGFHGIDVGEVPSLWLPAALSSQAIYGFHDMLNRRTRWMQILGRLAPGMSPARAQAGLQPWFKAMLHEDTRRPGFPRITAENRRLFLASTLAVTGAPQGHSPLRRRLSEPLWVLFAATAVLLALACLNVAGLFLARGSARAREITTRLALGASRGRVGRQLLADSMLIALAGGLLGVALAPIAVRALLASLPSGVAPTALQSTVDFRILLFALLASLAAGLSSGCVPALQAGRESLVASLRERAGTAFAAVHLRKAIVTAQIAFTLILVVGAALFVRTLTALMAKGPGFNTSSLVSFGVDPIRNGNSPAESSRLLQRIHAGIRRSPLTESSAVARFQLLTGGSWGNPLTIQSTHRIVTDRDVNLNAVTPGFFSTLGASIVSGRDFTPRDTLPLASGAHEIAIVNHAFARRYFPGRSPLGALLCQGAGTDAQPDTEIVGVVSDISYRGLRESDEQAYFPMREGEAFQGNFYLRVHGTPASAFAAIRAVVHEADPGLPLDYFRTVDEQVSRSLSTERLLAALSSSFGFLALLLSLVGLYGVMSFVVTQRTREIGIRLAIGATPAATLWLILRDALAMLLCGVTLALPCIWALGRLVASQLYEVKPTDPQAIVVPTVFLCIAAVGAALIPARRASTLNPTEALRFE